MDDEVDVLPDIVVILSVVLEALLGISVKSLSADTANEANILAVIVSLTLLVSQLGKCIDDDTEDDVQKNCDDQQEESKIVCRTEVETLSVFRRSSLSRQELTDTTTAS